MAESAATPIDLDDTLPEGVYQIDPLFKAIVDGDLQLATMFVRTRCFPRVPDEIVPLIVDYVFHVGFY